MPESLCSVHRAVPPDFSSFFDCLLYFRLCSLPLPKRVTLIIEKYSRKSLDADYQFSLQVQGLPEFQVFRGYFVEMRACQLFAKKCVIAMARILLDEDQKPPLIPLNDLRRLK